MSAVMGATGDGPAADDAAAPPLAPIASSSPPSEGGLGRRFAPAETACEFCGHAALDRHCKVVCPRCGAVRDCSDP